MAVFHKRRTLHAALANEVLHLAECGSKSAKAPLLTDDDYEVTCKHCLGERNYGQPQLTAEQRSEQKRTRLLGRIGVTEGGWNEDQIALSRRLVEALDLSTSTDRNFLVRLERLYRDVGVD